MENKIEEKIKVYVKTNEEGLITEVGSSIFIRDLTGWTQVDEGNGDKFAHAQSQYLAKGVLSDEGAFNYKLSNGKIEEV